VQRCRGGLVFKAHRLLYHSTLGLRVIQKMKEETPSARAGFGLKVQGPGYEVGLGFRVKGFGVWDLGLRVSGLGVKVWG